MGVFLCSLDEIKRNARVALYGAGTAGRRLRRRLRLERPDVAVDCYLDSRKGGVFDGLEVLPLGDVDPRSLAWDLILVASVYWHEMVEALATRGVTSFKVYDEVIHGEVIALEGSTARFEVERIL